MKKAAIRLNKEQVNKLVRFKFGTIENYLKANKISRMRYWQILNEPHLSKDVKCLQDLASNLEISIEEILL